MILGKFMDTKRKKTEKKSYPAALTIAGSDSGGGAGIQADLRTFNAYGVYGFSAVTAVTSQNPRAVSRIDAIPAAGVAGQISAVAGTLDVEYAKSGMLVSQDIVNVVAEAVEKYDLKLVCDPLMISTSGKKLLDDAAVEMMRSVLFPRAQWITPNVPEAETLLGKTIVSVPDMILAAKELEDLYGCSVVLKGGHLAENPSGKGLPRSVDVVCRKGELWKLSSLKMELPGFASHGTGCTFSSAFTAGLALGISWQDAICAAKSFVLGSLVENVCIGSGIFAMYPPGNDYSDSVTFEKAGEK